MFFCKVKPPIELESNTRRPELNVGGSHHKPGSVTCVGCSLYHLHQLKIGPPIDTTSVCSKFGHLNLDISWQHLQMLQIWSPDCVTLPWIAQLALSANIELVTSHQTSLYKV